VPEPAADGQLLTLAASSAEALDDRSRRLAAFLTTRSDVALADVAARLAAEADQPYRRAFVARDGVDAAAMFAAPDPHRVIDSVVTGPARPLVYLFPGVGEQSPGMAETLYANEAPFRLALDQCAELFVKHLERDLRDVLYAPHDRPWGERRAPLSTEPVVPRLIDETRFAQPIVFSVAYALAALYAHHGVEPTAMLGYSLGEYVAACLAGVFALPDAIDAVARRALLIEQTPPGAMAAVLLGPEQLSRQLGGDLWIAAVDAPSLCVVSGTVSAVTALTHRLTAEGVASRRLPTRHAFHSDLLAPVAPALRAALARVPMAPPRIPFLSNVTGTWISDEQAVDPAYWAQQMCGPVRFADAVDEIWHLASPILLEVGPGQTLSTLAGMHSGRGAGTVVASLPGSRQHSDQAAFRDGLGRLWTAGVPVQRRGTDSGRPVALPS
jgi:acyl transferase domain-containing protein